jgi:hypothetical protein
MKQERTEIMSAQLETIRDKLTTIATVVALSPVGEFEEDGRASVLLSETPMYPERFDRPGDIGLIEDVPVCRVSCGFDRRKRHHIADECPRFNVGEHVQIIVDRRQRSANAAQLCAGRLIEVIGNTVFVDLRSVGASYWTNRLWVEFGAAEYLPDPDSLLPHFRREIELALCNDLPVVVKPHEHSEFAQVQIGDYPPFICTGPFPTSLKALGDLIITRIVTKGGRLQVRFRLRHE